jgi:hypothetical protein
VAELASGLLLLLSRIEQVLEKKGSEDEASTFYAQAGPHF